MICMLMIFPLLVIGVQCPFALTAGATAPVADSVALWLKAGTGITADSNGKVSAWADQSGNGISLTQATYAKQPVLVPRAINGESVIRFNQNYLASSALSTAIDGNYTMLFVLKLSGTNYNANYDTFFSASEATTDDSIKGGTFALQNRSSNGYIQMATRGSLNGNTSNFPIAARASALAGYVTLAVKHSGNTLTVYMNGTQAYTITAATDVPNVKNIVRYCLGANSQTSTYYGDHDLAELIIYSKVLTDIERQQTELYFTEKYFTPKNTLEIIQQPQIQYKDSLGATVGGLQTGGSITVTSKVISYYTATKNATLIIALYDSQNRMVSCTYHDQALNRDVEKTYTCNITELPSISGHYVKVFLWDSLNGMVPITNSNQL